MTKKTILTSALVALAVSVSLHAQTLAFPEAQGFGAYARGGRGGNVFYVTTNEDNASGAPIPNSLRDVVNRSGPRTVLFAVGGEIRLQRDLIIDQPYLTLVGQGAPAPVIITGATTVIRTRDVIIRHLRFRLGNLSGAAGSCNQSNWNNTDCDRDVLYLDGERGTVQDIILDHCSFSWSIDEIIGADRVKRVTVQASILAEPLHWSLKHTENCAMDGECLGSIDEPGDWGIGHGYCQRWGGSKEVAILDSLLASCFKRGIQTNNPTHDKDHRIELYVGGNLFYDYYVSGITHNDKGEKADAEWMIEDNLFYKGGSCRYGRQVADPSTDFKLRESKLIPIEIERAGDAENLVFQRRNQIYRVSYDRDHYSRRSDCEREHGAGFCNNYFFGSIAKCCPGYTGLFDGCIPKLVSNPAPPEPLFGPTLENVTLADEPPEFVRDMIRVPRAPSVSGLSGFLLTVGAFKPERDGADLALFDKIRTGRTGLHNQAGFTGSVIPLGHRLGCVPDQMPRDSDCDGMPDDFEIEQGFDPRDARDGAQDRDGDGYTNVEEWLNGTRP